MHLCESKLCLMCVSCAVDYFEADGRPYKLTVDDLSRELSVRQSVRLAFSLWQCKVGLEKRLALHYKSARREDLRNKTSYTLVKTELIRHLSFVTNYLRDQQVTSWPLHMPKEHQQAGHDAKQTKAVSESLGYIRLETTSM